MTSLLQNFTETKASLRPHSVRLLSTIWMHSLILGRLRTMAIKYNCPHW